MEAPVIHAADATMGIQLLEVHVRLLAPEPLLFPVQAPGAGFTVMMLSDVDASVKKYLRREGPIRST
jgi:hypothetical protein